MSRNIRNTLKRFLLSLLVLICANIYSQKESTYWYFGDGAGLDFSSGSPVAITNSQMFASEGCAAISDCNGDLLFYSNGVDIWNRNHQAMQNGNGLLGDVSSAQGVVIVPKPNENNIYYIFTIDDKAGDNGLRYSKIDMSLNSGNGAVVLSEKNILLDDQTTERLAVVGHANGQDFWVIAHDWNSSHFQSYLINSSGVNTPIVSAIGASYGGHPDNAIGCIKVSPNGSRLAISKISPDEERFVQVFDFDNSTGLLSNSVFINGVFYGDGLSGTYGLEFSPDSDLLYVSDIKTEEGLSRVHQFNISLDSPLEIINSDVILYTGNGVLGSLQMALNGKIYISQLNSSNLHSIENPNVIGEESNFIYDSISLNGAQSYYGLPQFIFNDLSFQIDDVQETCSGESINFSITTSEIIDSILWDFGDGNTSNSENPSHTYTDAGSYVVNVTINYGVYCKSKSKIVTVTGIPNLDTLPNYEVCDDESGDGFETFDLTAYFEQIIDVESEQFAFTYHSSYNDAVNHINILDQFYTNSIPNEEFVYIRIESAINSSCFQIAPVLLVVNPLYQLEDGSQISIDFEITDWSSNNNSIMVIVNGEGDFEYSIDGYNYQDSPFFYGLEPNVYLVYVKDVDDCRISKKEVFLLHYPKVFTPNGDGVNDFWQIKYGYEELNITIFIYDRYGKLIKQIAPNSNGWDGTFNGIELPVSDYWFVVKRPNNHIEYTGHFTLKR